MRQDLHSAGYLKLLLTGLNPNSWVNQTLKVSVVLESHVGSAGYPGVGHVRCRMNDSNITIPQPRDTQRDGYYLMRLDIVLYYVFKLGAQVVSGLAIYLGYRLFVLGVSGQASLSINNNTVSGQLLNAAPGLFFALGGIIALIFSIRKGVQIDYRVGAEPPQTIGTETARYPTPVPGITTFSRSEVRSAR
jgi:hypothetical protein